MAYIGASPPATALTASDIADGIISTAKLAADAVTVPKLDDSIDHINFKNRLINGDMAVAQRGTSFTSATRNTNNDDAYHLDRWYVLSDTNDVVDITQSSTAPTNQLYSCALDVETANKKFGIAQIIENKNCTGLIGQTATLSFKAKASAVDKLDNVKCAIISWSSTADSVTSDLVSAWGVEGTNPTLASNLTYENTPANLSVTTSWATYSVSADIDTSSTTNVAVFIWSDVTDTTAGQFLYITDVQLEVAAAATDFERIPYDVNFERCLRYYNKIVSGTGVHIAHMGYNTSSNLAGSIHLSPFMRANPSLDITTGTDYYRSYRDGGSDDFNGFALDTSRPNYIYVYDNATASGTAGYAAIVNTANSSAYIAADAEL